MNNIDLSNIVGASYVGEPKNYTIMYVTSKVGYLLKNLVGHKGCIVFVEDNIDIPKEIDDENIFVKVANPQYEYAKCATEIWKKQLKQESEYMYTLTDGGFYIGQKVTIGKNAYIEPGVLIGHGVSIGDNAIIMAGSVIKHATIGDNFVCNENAVIGANGFTMAIGDSDEKIRIPSLGKVVIGNFVEIGVGDNISRGSGGNTIIGDYVKIDALVHVGHDVHIRNNAEIVAGSVVGGFDEIGENSFIGINASLRNRIVIGKNTVVGMGATVTKNVEQGEVVVGNPAKPFQKDSD